MRTVRFVGLVIALGALTLAGCQGKLREENALLATELGDVRAELDQQRTALTAAERELHDAQAEVLRLRRELSEAERAADERADERTRSPVTGFENIPGVTGAAGVGQVTATVESDILFDSGKATLKSNAKQSLNAVANVLQSTYAGQPITVTGYTDTDPIRKSGFKSNYHLGFERAMAVREYLVQRGVPANRIAVKSWGESRPLATKAQSRRVEIVVSMVE